MQTINVGNATTVAYGKMVTEASRIGLAPGSFPVELKTIVGNKLPFRLQQVDNDGVAQYKQLHGAITLAVLND